MNALTSKENLDPITIFSVMKFTTMRARLLITKLRIGTLAMPRRLSSITRFLKESFLMPLTLTMLRIKGPLLLFTLLGTRVVLKVFFKTHCPLHSLSKSIHSRGYNERTNPTIKAFPKLFNFLGFIQNQVRSKARELNKLCSILLHCHSPLNQIRKFSSLTTLLY